MSFHTALHHPQGSTLSSCSLCSHRLEKDNIRQRNLTFDTQMLGWSPDFNPLRCGGVLLTTLTHTVMRGWDRGQRGEAVNVGKFRKVEVDNGILVVLASMPWAEFLPLLEDRKFLSCPCRLELSVPKGFMEGTQLGGMHSKHKNLHGDIHEGSKG